MAMICQALILLATISAVFSSLPQLYDLKGCAREFYECISGGFSRIPAEHNCAWEKNRCTRDRIFLTQCNCQCGGLGVSLLCCDESVLDEYDYPVWHGTAPFCGASCAADCGSNNPDVCWWQSSCGNGRKCMTGSKVLCGIPKNRNRYPFLDKTVSSLPHWDI